MDFEQLEEAFASFEQAIAACNAELDEIALQLTEVRLRQKAQFGDMLLRTTLNRPLSELLREHDGE